VAECHRKWHEAPILRHMMQKRGEKSARSTGLLLLLPVYCNQASLYDVHMEWMRKRLGVVQAASGWEGLLFISKQLSANCT
jgi:hypothetical protein